LFAANGSGEAGALPEMGLEDDFVTTPTPGGVARRLRDAREAAGLSLADIAARTRIAARQLAAVEEGRFNDLVSRTYAVGFARAYARTVGLPEHEIAAAVRAETERLGEVERPRPAPFEPGDPARVPSRGLAWGAALAALALVIAGFFLWRSHFAPSAPLADLVPESTPTAMATPTAAPSAAASAPAAPAGGAVVFTATEPNIWVKFYDASGTQLMQKQMAQGESYTVPAGAIGPQLWTGRPDALAITVGGRPVAPIGTRPGKVKDVPIDAASLLGRHLPAPAPSAIPATPAPVGIPSGAMTDAPAVPPPLPDAT
jgi:cytoskeletal protein RodZ